jgi:phenylacetate-CoA ligase
MSLLAAYHRLPVPLQEFALSLYGARLRVMRYGGVQRDRLAWLRQTEQLPEGSLAQLQRELLAETLRHAASTVPYYRALKLPVPASADDAVACLRHWPILEKKTIQEQPEAFVSDLADRKRLVEIHTGGTTGRALVVYADRSSLQQNYAFFERLKRWAGIGEWDRVATFAGRPVVPPAQPNPPYWRRNYAANQLLCSSYHIGPTSIPHYVDALASFAPRLIDSYPSSLEPLARWMLQTGDQRVRPAAIITSSETLLPESRSVIEEAFRCRVFDQYGSAEMVGFVSQCEHHSYHEHVEYGFLELLNESLEWTRDGEEGEIVSTGFLNRAMPLVRYRMGDIAVRSSAACACGRGYPRLDRVIGRLDDVVVTPDGRRVGRLDPIFKAVSTLHEARIVQTELDCVDVEIVAGPGFRNSDGEALLAELRLRLGPSMKLQVKMVEAIPRTGRGKLRTVERRLAHEPSNDTGVTGKPS